MRFTSTAERKIKQASNFMPTAQTAYLQAAQPNEQPKLVKEPFFAHAPTEKTIFAT
ncbi:MAG: hypothetical protein M9892_03380 [Bacteroidetes bacterium]|nr:hypothetical protein [Bacteroidota bacterium]